MSALRDMDKMDIMEIINIEVTKNSVRRADNVGRNESKSERDTPVVRGEVKLDSKGGENSSIYF